MTENRVYDAVIVGAGVAGALLAKHLSEAGHSVLLLEAGRATSVTPEGYLSYVERYFTSPIKVPNAPYPASFFAPQPDVLDRRPPRTANGSTRIIPSTVGYLVQKGAAPFGSDYARSQGGTTLHWLGTCLRMLPHDFRLRTRYNRGVDWPFGYPELEPDYERAERDIGVSADVADQAYLGLTFRADYSYPMRKIPQSYLDRWLGRKLEDMTWQDGGQSYPVRVSSLPQGRNSMPNPAYRDPDRPDRAPGYQPRGAAGSPLTGQRCEGNASCIPICPVQAKYNALKTLEDLKQKIDIQTQAVVTRLELDPHNPRRVAAVVYQPYEKEAPPAGPEVRACGRVFLLAAHSIENAKLVLHSHDLDAGVCRGSIDQVGRHLMDHPYVLTAARVEEPLGPYRGPGITSTISSLADGDFRRDRAAFRVDISNWGWSLSHGHPGRLVEELVLKGTFGSQLRKELYEQTRGQLLLGFLLEQLPDPDNRVTLDRENLDPLGLPRPAVTYAVSDYTRAGMVAAKRLSDAVYARVGARESPQSSEELRASPGYLAFTDESGRHEFSFMGAGHAVGTHRMGTDPSQSVVNSYQQAHDHDNLYLVGCGSMPTIATGNPTLTLAALAIRTARHVAALLRAVAAPAAPPPPRPG